MKADDNVDLERLRAFCAEIDQHFDEIEKLNNDAKQSGEDLSEAFGGNE